MNVNIIASDKRPALDIVTGDPHRHDAVHIHNILIQRATAAAEFLMAKNCFFI